ncbi:hypothetical protein DFH11DRAFT_1651088 [Phellopilus nigrolimitatus]|nr:hypothetical protein DFH11DRAFT_1651088 [Phellopilus nigrolimitatus]
MKQGQSTCEPVSASSLLLLQLLSAMRTRTSLWCCQWLRKELNTVGEKMSSSIAHFQHLAFAFKYIRAIRNICYSVDT